MRRRWWWLRWMRFLWILFVVGHVIRGSSDEYRLIQDLKQGYDPIERPVMDHNNSLTVRLRLLLQQIADVDERNQMITLVLWTEYTWTDYKMKWTPEEYGGISRIELPAGMLWKPDILLFNSADEHFDAGFPVNFVVQYTGEVLMAPPGIVKFSCDIDITWFPFDEQICYLKYGSWTYPGSKLDLQNATHEIDQQYYIKNGEWDLIQTPAKRKAQKFNNDEYVELLYFLHIRRKTIYYGLNWIVPSMLISLSNVLGFNLPPESGEKITLQITNLLSVTVFLGMVADVTPPTSESVPVIAAFFGVSMVILGSSIVFTVLIINFHFRSAKTHEMSEWMKSLFLNWLPWLLLMKRPGTFLKKPRRRSKPKDVIVEKVKVRRKDSVAARLVQHENNVCTKNQAEKQADYVASARSISTVTALTQTSIEPLLSEMRDLMRAVVNRIEEEDNEEEAREDWHFVAMVFDRFCLFLFSLAILGACALIFLSTPSITQGLDI
uniref:Neur_chan_LBD domain-containing protein n=1 Tax=Steinernema glaseri TaxID=37863 RepID=A0A1I8AVN7_9BILA